MNIFLKCLSYTQQFNFQIIYKNYSEEYNTMDNYISEHLELAPSPHKFMGLSMASTNNSSAPKSHTNFDIFQNAQSYRTFDSIKMELAKNNELVLGSQTRDGIRKVTKRPTFQQKPKNNSKKPNNRQKDELQKKNKGQLSVPAQQKDERIQQLEVRCMQLDEQLKQLKGKQRRTTNNANRGVKVDNQYLSKIMLTVQQHFAKKNISLKLQPPPNDIKLPAEPYENLITLKPSDFRNSPEQKTTKSSHFVDKLKRKLNQQIQKIKQTNRPTRDINAGCIVKKNTFSNSRDALRTPLTERRKIKPSLTRSGVEITSRDSVKAKRPESSKQRLLQSQEMKFKIKKIQEQDQLQLRGLKMAAKKHQKISKSNYNNRHSEPDINKTFRHISPMYLRRNWSATKREVEQQKIKEKMLTILIDCDGESVRRQTIESGIKAFETFSKKMVKRLAKTKRLINNIQYTQTLPQHQVDEEYY